MIARITDVYIDDAAFTPDECRAALSLFPSPQTATVNSSNVTRRSRASFLRDETEAARLLKDKLTSLLSRVNGHVHRFDLVTEWRHSPWHDPGELPTAYAAIEPIQLAEYAVGEEYDWHLDLGPGAAQLRKLSVSVQLTDPNEYDGGELEIRGAGIAPREQGTAIIFPSFLLHRVKPVTRGLRRSLVAWAIGEKPFR